MTSMTSSIVRLDQPRPVLKTLIPCVPSVNGNSNSNNSNSNLPHLTLIEHLPLFLWLNQAPGVNPKPTGGSSTRRMPSLAAMHPTSFTHLPHPHLLPSITISNRHPLPSHLPNK